MLRRANISAERVVTIEGNPGVFMAKAPLVASLLGGLQMQRARFIVGYREPAALAVSWYSFHRRPPQHLAEHMGEAVGGSRQASGAPHR